MKNQKLKALTIGSIAAMAMGLSSGVAAQGLYPAGPVEINGYVSVDNTGRGGNFTDFACKIKGYGRIMDQPNNTQILIEGVQALHRSSGQIPRGCYLVQTWNFPWVVSINAAPVPHAFPYSGISSTGNVTISGIAFQAVGSGEPGCGTALKPPGGTITAGATWTQDTVPFAHSSNLPKYAADPSYSTITLDSAVIQEADEGKENCAISGILKVTRPVGPSWTTVTK